MNTTESPQKAFLDISDPTTKSALADLLPGQGYMIVENAESADLIITDKPGTIANAPNAKHLILITSTNPLLAPVNLDHIPPPKLNHRDLELLLGFKRR